MIDEIQVENLALIREATLVPARARRRCSRR